MSGIRKGDTAPFCRRILFPGRRRREGEVTSLRKFRKLVIGGIESKIVLLIIIALLLLAGEDTFRETSLRNSFKSPWWEAGPIWYLNHTSNDQVACMVEDHPAASMLPYSGAWKLDLFYALEQAPAVNIDALGLDVEPVIYGVNTRMDRLCYLFQFALGQGSVVVCTLNHRRRDVEHIEVDYVLKSLINYAMSPACSPIKRLTAEQLRKALKR